MSAKVTCSCGHSWSKSDSSKKDVNVCHICGKDNTMKDGGWLDKYQKGGSVNERMDNEIVGFLKNLITPEVTRSDAPARITTAPKDQSLNSKMLDVVSHPVTAFKHLVNEGRLPNNFAAASPLGIDTALDITGLNPLGYASLFHDMGASTLNLVTGKGSLGDLITLPVTGLAMLPGAKTAANIVGRHMASNSNFYSPIFNTIEKGANKIRSKVKQVDQKLGEKVFTNKDNLPQVRDIDPSDLESSINYNLKKGLGIKKIDLPMSVTVTKNTSSGNNFNIGNILDGQRTGSVTLEQNLNPFKKQSLSRGVIDAIYPKGNAWANTPGFKKLSDFPFSNIESGNSAITYSGSDYNYNDLINSGVSGELNKAINETLKANNLGNIISGGTGHSTLGKKRWDNLVSKGHAENLGPGKYKLKENGGWLDKYEPGGTVAKTDATRVAAPALKLTKAQLDKNKAINKEVMVNTEKANAKILAERKKGIAESSEADIINPNGKRFAIGDKFRMFPNDVGGYGEVFDDFINPAVFVGNTASGLGNAMIDRDPKAFATEAGMTLGTGALGFDPLGSAMKVPGKVAQSMESGLLSNAHNINPFAISENPEMYLYRAQPENFNTQNTIDFMRQELLANRSKPWYKSVINSYEEGHPSLVAQNDFHGSWYESNPERLDWYLHSGDKVDVGTPMEILRGKINKNSSSKFSIKNNPKAKPVSLSPETEFVVPKNITESFEKFPQSSWKKLIEEDKKFNTPHWLKGYKEVRKPSVDFSKYLTQEEAIAARAKRLISQKDKPGWNEQFTPDLETRLNNAVKNHDPASNYPGEKLGSNILGRTATLVSKDANLSGVPLTEANKARVAAHETGHYYSNSFAEGEEWLKPFNLNKLESYKTKTYLRGKGRSNNYANEIRERAAQLKDYIAQKNAIPLNQDFKITQTQLDDAIKNYVKDTGLDNTMSKMLGTLKNKKGLLKTMNKYALGAAPVGIVAGALQQKKENGGWLDKFDDGGPVQPNYNDYSVSAGEGFQGDGYSNVGRNYSPAWEGQFEDGGNLSFIKDPKLRNMLEGYQSGLMQPGDYRLPEGRMAGSIDPSSEVSISIGGEQEEPSYLIPSFKYGSPLQDPTQEFNMTGQHLGGPFKTWQDAEAYGELRHQYIDKGYKELPSPIATSNMAMGGSLPGATGFMYARVGAPSNGKYAKKTKASAENGTEMRYYQEGFDFNPKSISEDGSKNSKLTNQEMIKKLGLKPVKTVNPIEQENLYAPKGNPVTGDGTLMDAYNFEKDMLQRGLEVVANPISALSALNRHGRLPRNFSKGEYSPFDIATSWENPFARIESIMDTYQSAKDVISGKGNIADYVDLGLTAHSSLGIGKAVGKKIKKIKETINFNKQQKLLPNRDAADWMKNMYSDPVIKQRILDNTPDEFTKGYTDHSYNHETGEVISNVIPDQFKAKRFFWNDPVTNPIGNKNYNDLYKEKGFKDWTRHYQTTNGLSYGMPEEIYVKNKLFDKAERESVRVHEATHAMEHNGWAFFTEEEEKLLKPFGLTKAEQYTLPPDNYGKKYYTDPTEIHARMNESRYKLGHTPGQKYTMDDFNKSTLMDNMDGMARYIKDPKAFVDLMNTFYQAAPVLGAGALGAAAIANQPEMEQGGQLTKLDQLTNFTNYNTKQPGGWLDKYQ